MSKSSKWPLAVGGMALGGLAVWGIRRWMIERRDDDIDLPDDVIQAGSQTLPIQGMSEVQASNEGQGEAIRQRNVISNMPSDKSSSRVLKLGNLKIIIRRPKCRIVFSKSHWSGSRLDGYYNSGDIVSHDQGNKIMWTASYDGGPVTYQKVNGKIPERIGDPDEVLIAPWKLQHDALRAMPFPLGSTWSLLENSLITSGFDKIKLNDDGWASINLPAGKYTIIAKPSPITSSQKWSYVKGFWKWTTDGPREKSCNDWLDRIRDQLKHVNCEKLATKFTRVVSPQLWGDLMTTATVTQTAEKVSTGDRRAHPYPTQSVSFTPIMTMQISNREYGTSTTSSAYYVGCATMISLDAAAKAMGAKISMKQILGVLSKIGGLSGVCD